MTFRLHARKGTSFLIAVEAEIGSTVSVALVRPDLTADPLSPIALVDTDGVGRFTAAYVPQTIGTHTLTVSSTDGTDGETVDMVVTSSAQLNGGTDYGDDFTDSGLRLRWPCPDVRKLACVGAYSVEQIETWAQIATETVFTDTCQRFPGTDNWVELRPVATSACLVSLSTSRGQRQGLDLFPTVGYPVLEIESVTINGVSSVGTGWRIEEDRYLVADLATSWPSQDIRVGNGGADTWSVTVRYGRTPPGIAVKGRDQLMMAMLLGNEMPTTVGAACTVGDGGLVSLSEGGRTMTFDPENSTRLYDEAVKRWKCRKTNRSFIIDPAESLSRGSSTVYVESGNAAPSAVGVFGGSGCNLPAELALL